MECVWKFFIVHEDNFFLYDTKKFWIAQKFTDSNATLLLGFFSLCISDSFVIIVLVSYIFLFLFRFIGPNICNCQQISNIEIPRICVCGDKKNIILFVHAYLSANLTQITYSIVNVNPHLFVFNPRE